MLEGFHIETIPAESHPDRLLSKGIVPCVSERDLCDSPENDEPVRKLDDSDVDGLVHNEFIGNTSLSLTRPYQAGCQGARPDWYPPANNRHHRTYERDQGQKEDPANSRTVAFYAKYSGK